MVSLFFRGVLKTCPMLRRFGASLSSYNKHFPRKIQIEKFFPSQIRTQHEEKKFNVQQRDQLSRGKFFLPSKVLKCSQDGVKSLTTKHPSLKSMLQARSLLTDNPVKGQEQVIISLGYSVKKFDIIYNNMCDDFDALDGCANKSERIAEIFRCNLKDVDSLITQHPGLETMSMPLLEQKVNLLLSYNLPLSLITKNVRPLFNSHEELSRRLELLQARSLLTDNPVRSQEQVFNFLGYNVKKFDIGYKNMCDELDALKGCTCPTEYLQMRLECDKRTADFLASSLSLCDFKTNKLKNTLDFLLNEAKLNSDYVIVHRKLLKYSIRRLKERWDAMQSAGIPVDSYLNLCEKNGTYKRLNADLAALQGCKTKSEYLQKRLKCSKETADKLLLFNKLKGTSISKIQSVLDVLLTEIKVHPEYILKHPSLFTHSVRKLSQHCKTPD